MIKGQMMTCTVKENWCKLAHINPLRSTRLCVKLLHQQLMLQGNAESDVPQKVTDLCRRQSNEWVAASTKISSYLVVLRGRRARSVQRGRWRRTCWRSALWSSTASPSPGQTRGTSESSPPCPGWPGPSFSALPRTDQGAALINTKHISMVSSIPRAPSLSLTLSNILQGSD